MKDDKAQAILDSWSNLRDKAEEDLAYLMKVQDIKHIAALSYTPGFNDGDSCEQTFVFLGKPNYVYEDYFVYLDEEGNPNVIYIEELNEDTITDLIDEGVDKEIITALQEWLDSNRYSLVPTYPLEGFESFLWKVSEHIFPTDSLVLVTLQEDGTLSWYTEAYDCGY
jgi:hypothetical protein